MPTVFPLHFRKCLARPSVQTRAQARQGQALPRRCPACWTWVTVPRCQCFQWVARLRSDAGAARQIRAVEDVLQVGQEVDVVCTGRDAKGHLMVSRKALLSPPSGSAAARAASSA